MEGFTYLGLRIDRDTFDTCLETIREASLGQQFFCFLHVVLISLIVRVMPRHERREDLIGNRRAPVEELHNALFVNGMVESLPDLQLVKGWFGCVDGDIGGVDLRLLLDAIGPGRVIGDAGPIRARRWIARASPSMLPTVSLGFRLE